MSNLFDRLSEASGSAGALDGFLSENIRQLNEIYNADHHSLLAVKEAIERFILLKYPVYSELDYSKGYTQSFALILLDFCERFNFLSATPRIYEIFRNNHIPVNSRLAAALQCLYPKPPDNSALVGRFNPICEKLQYAIEHEEDNDKKVIATFLNYYGFVVYNTNSEFAEQIRVKVRVAIENQTYSFLLNEAVAEVLSIEVRDSSAAYKRIQEIIDKVLDRKEVETSIPFTGDLLIEEGTEYSEMLENVPARFDDIRMISVHKAPGYGNTGRGVKILEDGDELFEYMKRFGNMHKAKILSALDEAFPQKFPAKVNIIDWGCGQGIASMVFLEKYGGQRVNAILLIDPSIPSLQRAALHCRKYDPQLVLKTIPKKLDELTVEDFSDFTPSAITVHLFSNILDIEDYSQTRLLQLLEKMMTGQNYFVCASPFVDVIKTEKLESFRRYFEKKYTSFELIRDIINRKSEDDLFWNCNNTFKKQQCPDHALNGCYHKWTRVIKTFKLSAGA